MTGFKPSREKILGLDIGAGAGYLAAALSAYGGFNMTASEWNEDGIALIRQENPQLKTRLLDIMQFNDKNIWDFIICRELYPFTRVNSFSDQYKIIFEIIDALTPGGIFVLIGSRASFPHCSDYSLLIKTFRKDPRVKIVTSPILETILRRINRLSFLRKPGYWMARVLGGIIIPVIKGHSWADIQVIVFQKK